MNAMEFFERSAGQWRSRRTTHHLALRRAETGTSLITVETLGPQDDRIQAICQFHQVDGSEALGGAFITWRGSMEWDQNEQTHDGASVFALVPHPSPDASLDPEPSPEPGDPATGETSPKGITSGGHLLREQGYGEMVPVMGCYAMDPDDRLILATDYETLSATEYFWFGAPDLRIRISTVKRLGGFVTASFCLETPYPEPEPTPSPAPGDFTPLPPSVWGW